MKLIATIELSPSFSPFYQTWKIKITRKRQYVVLIGHDYQLTWNLNAKELDSLPVEVKRGIFPDIIDPGCVLDGIGVDFKISTDAGKQRIHIQSPDRISAPEYSRLLEWCWKGLFQRSTQSESGALMYLFDVFPYLDIPILENDSGFSLYNQLYQSDEEEIRNAFQKISGLEHPIINMDELNEMDVTLYPLFKDFQTTHPSCKWIVNDEIRKQLIEAGVTEKSMEERKEESPPQQEENMSNEKEAGPIAKKEDWKTEPFPDCWISGEINVKYSLQEFELIKKGLVPQQMEDKWFIYFEDNKLYFHRSWTGYCIYKAEFEVNPYCCKIVTLYMNREFGQNKDIHFKEDEKIFLYLVDLLLLHKPVNFPGTEDTDGLDPVREWSLVGNGMFKGPMGDKE